MAIQGFAFIPVTTIEKPGAFPLNRYISLGNVSCDSKNYHVYAVYTQGRLGVEPADKEDIEKVCRKIQKCLDNLPGFCKGPECWGEAGFRFRRLRIPNTFETANFSKCGGDVFKRCQEILTPPTKPSKPSKPPEKIIRLAAYQKLTDALLDSLKNSPIDKEQVKRLIEQAIQLENKNGAADLCGFRMMHYLIAYGDMELIAYALSKGTDPNAKDINQERSYLHLIYDKSFQDEIFGILDQKEIVTHSSKERLKQNALEMTKQLIKDGAEVNSVDSKGQTPLHHHGNDIEVVRLLLKNGANPNARMTAGPHWTPFYLANKDTIPVFLKYGVDVNECQNDFQETLAQRFFHHACYWAEKEDTDEKCGPCLDMVQLLIEHGANPRSFASRGHRLYANKNRSANLIPLSPTERNQTFLGLAVQNHWVSFAKFLIEKIGAKEALDGINHDGKTLFQIAVENLKGEQKEEGSQSIEMMKMLIEKGADVNVGFKVGPEGQQKRTNLLAFAKEKKWTKFTQFLQDRKGT